MPITFPLQSSKYTLKHYEHLWAALLLRLLHRYTQRLSNFPQGSALFIYLFILTLQNWVNASVRMRDTCRDRTPGSCYSLRTDSTPPPPLITQPTLPPTLIPSLTSPQPPQVPVTGHAGNDRDVCPPGRRLQATAEAVSSDHLGRRPEYPSIFFTRSL